jgi:hypothetical protein
LSIAADEREASDTIGENFPDSDAATNAESQANVLEEASDEALEIVDLLESIEANCEAATD